jgi:hypothetical protein
MITKNDVEIRILKLKHELHDGSWSARNNDWHEGAHQALDRVLEYLQEYRL